MKLTPWMLSLTGFGIVIALTGGFVFKQMKADSVRPRTAFQQPVRFAATETVPVALSDILPGTRIEASYLTEAPILTTKVRKHRDTVRSANALVGRIAKQKISVAAPIRLSMFHPVNRKPEIRIPPGQRLVSVQVEKQTGFLSGLIQSGSYVDVFATMTSAASNKGPEVVQLFEGVRVYEVFTSANGPGGQNEAVLELNPDQQKVMLLAKERGRISLTYNPEGPGVAGIAADTMAAQAVLTNDVFARQPTSSQERVDVPEHPQPNPTFVTEQFRNGIRSQAIYDNSGNTMRSPLSSKLTIPSKDQNAAKEDSAMPISWSRVQ